MTSPFYQHMTSIVLIKPNLWRDENLQKHVTLGEHLQPHK